MLKHLRALFIRILGGTPPRPRRARRPDRVRVRRPFIPPELNFVAPASIEVTVAHRTVEDWYPSGQRRS